MSQRAMKGLRVAGAAAALIAAAAIAGVRAQPDTKPGIPEFASINYGWQHNEEDWLDAPPGAAHGPIREKPEYPFVNNADGGRTHQQVTVRITNTRDPILKPWAAQQIEATNQEVLSGKHPIPFTA